MDGRLRAKALIITPTILRLVAAIDEFKGAWVATGRIGPERLSALRRVATIESIGASTRIEGARLSDKEVGALLTGLSIDKLAARDEQQVAGYAKTIEVVLERWDTLALTENHVKQLHRDLLEYSSEDARHRGEYKTHNNRVEAFGPDGARLGIVFATAKAVDTPRLMRELIEWTRVNVESGELHPLIVIALFLVELLAIHPFEDGNGRLARILATLLLLRAGYAHVPYSSLERVIEQHKEACYRALRQTQTTLRDGAPNWQPWLTFFLQSLEQQKARLVEKIQPERLSVADLPDLPDLSVRILELARERGRVTVAEIVKVTGTSRNTIKDHLKALTNAQHLTQHGAGRGVWYGLE